MKPRKRVTLRDIAQRAGVATGTVSMVLNSSPLVADATRTRVQRVITQLGYVYDRGAGQMRNKRTNIVGVSICNLVNPYFAEITAGIERSLDALLENDFIVRVVELPPGEDPDSLVRRDSRSSVRPIPVAAPAEPACGDSPFARGLWSTALR